MQRLKLENSMTNKQKDGAPANNNGIRIGAKIAPCSHGQGHDAK